MLGIKLADLDVGTLREIFMIYARLIGGKTQELVFLPKQSPLGDWLGEINDKVACGDQHIEFRMGAGICGDEENAKLVIEQAPDSEANTIIRFLYEPNMLRKSEEAEAMRKIFERNVDYFLFSRNLAVFVNSCGRRSLFSKLSAGLDKKADGWDSMWLAAIEIEADNAKKRFLRQIGLAGNVYEYPITCNRIDDWLSRIKKKASAVHEEKEGLGKDDKDQFIQDLAVICEIVGWNKD